MYIDVVRQTTSWPWPLILVVQKNISFQNVVQPETTHLTGLVNLKKKLR